MAFFVFVLFIAVNIASKLTLHNMGKVHLFNLPSLKSGGLHLKKEKKEKEKKNRFFNH